MTLTIREAVESDTDTIPGFIRDLAEYERLSHEVVADALRTMFRMDGDALLALDRSSPGG